jgi:polyphosphate kinase
LLSSERELGEDVHALFMQLTGLGKEARLRKLLHSPFTLQRTLIALIDREAATARSGKPGRIIAKMNSLSEARIIQALYRASQAGVVIDLIVRGICCLRPGVQGLSENIRVRSIVGRFLEHSRIFYFLADGAELTYCSSADWMDRNFHTRVETCFPVEDPRLKERVIDEGLRAYLADNVQAWLLLPDGTYRRARPGKEARAAQQVLLGMLTGRSEGA